MFGVYCSFSFLIVWWRFHIDCVRLEYSITCFMQHGWVCFVFVFVFICFFCLLFRLIFVSLLRFMDRDWNLMR